MDTTFFNKLQQLEEKAQSESEKIIPIKQDLYAIVRVHGRRHLETEYDFKACSCNGYCGGNFRYSGCSCNGYCGSNYRKD